MDNPRRRTETVNEKVRFESLIVWVVYHERAKQAAGVELVSVEFFGHWFFLLNASKLAGCTIVDVLRRSSARSKSGNERSWSSMTTECLGVP